MKCTILSFMMIFLGAISGATAGGVDVSGLKSAWAVDGVSAKGNSCRESYVVDAVIGPSTCVESNSAVCDGAAYGSYGTMMLVARTIIEHGVELCPTVVVSYHEKNHKAHTYYKDSSPKGECIWLCQNGYSGTACADNNNSSAIPAPNKVERANYASLKINKNNANIESLIPMFDMNQYIKCKSTYSMEHDVILAASRWLPNGRGVYVSPFVVRAQYTKYNQHESWPVISRVGKETLVCVNGYKHNTLGNDCEPINATVAAEQNAISKLCSGWNAADYDSSIHKFIVSPSDASCNQYRCTQSGYGFDVVSRSRCIACDTSLRQGISKTDGNCITCSNDTIFDGDKCSSAVKTYTKLDMQYGKGNTKNTIEFKFQCWTKTDPEEYKSCVVNGGPVNKGRTSAVVAPTIRQINVSGSLPLREFTGKLL